MKLWTRTKSDAPSIVQTAEPGELASISPYITEYMTAIERTERFGFEAPPRIFVKNECTDARVLPVLLGYFDEHSSDEPTGQTLAIHFALLPRLYAKTGVTFILTVGWIEFEGKTFCAHDESLIRRFVEGGSEAWVREGCPFHLWLTSPAGEVMDITFAMNLGRSKSREQCVNAILYQSAREPPGKLIYHPTVVGPNFFRKTGAVL